MTDAETQGRDISETHIFREANDARRWRAGALRSKRMDPPSIAARAAAVESVSDALRVANDVSDGIDTAGAVIDTVQTVRDNLSPDDLRNLAEAVEATQADAKGDGGGKGSKMKFGEYALLALALLGFVYVLRKRRALKSTVA